MSATIYAAIATVLAAFIAGTIAFINIILSKEQKTSEFRQAWIDSLRDDISEFVSRIEVVSAFLSAGNSSDPESDKLKILNDRAEELREAATRYYRIKLRLNPKEHKDLLRIIECTFDIISSPTKAYDREYVGENLENLIINSQKVLKFEWDRVKRGEVPFMLIKYSSLFIVIIFLIALSISGYFYLTSNQILICAGDTLASTNCLLI